MKKEQTLEQELKNAILKHKCLIIAGAIYAFESEITNNQLFEDVLKKTKSNKELEFQVDLAKRVIEYTQKYDSERLDKIYDLCWEKSKKFIPENETYDKFEFDDLDNLDL